MPLALTLNTLRMAAPLPGEHGYPTCNGKDASSNGFPAAARERTLEGSRGCRRMETHTSTGPSSLPHQNECAPKGTPQKQRPPGKGDAQLAPVAGDDPLALAAVIGTPADVGENGTFARGRARRPAEKTVQVESECLVQATAKEYFRSRIQVEHGPQRVQPNGSVSHSRQSAANAGVVSFQLDRTQLHFSRCPCIPPQSQPSHAGVMPLTRGQIRGTKTNTPFACVSDLFTRFA
jgi:hypothetical protein